MENSSQAKTGVRPVLNSQVAQGITRRHARGCSYATANRCSCKPTYQAMVWAARERKPVRKTFKTLKDARSWRQTAQVDLRRRQLNAPSAILLEDAARDWIAGARTGVIRTRSGEPYKPSALRGYEASLRRSILPALGHLRLSAITRNRVQDLVDELTASGIASSTVANAVLPLRAIFRRAEDRDEISVNPMARISLPKDRGRRERIADPREVDALLAQLPPHHRVLWATAVYAGLRRGELQALRWEAVDLDRGVLRVLHSWDRIAGLVTPKSRSGERIVPVPAMLKTELREHRLRQEGGGEGYIFSSTGEKPFDPSNALRRANARWRAAELKPLGFHEARHTYASFMIAAGVNPKALSSYMGHSSITVTLDRYGHLMPGNEKEAAGLLDAFLERDRQKHLRSVA